jgi:hypothetical protein
MTGSGKTVGLIAIVAGIVVFLGAALWIGSGWRMGQTDGPAALLGITLCGAIPLLLLGGFGVFMLIRGQAEERDLAGVRKKERLLGMIQAQGKVSLSSAMIEMKMTRQEVNNAVYELVNQGLFAGYIDWSNQTFYSQDAARVGSNKCPNCGGVRELVGKGIVKCPYCGVELFIPPDAPQTTAVPAPPAAQAGPPPGSAGSSPPPQ